MSIDSCELGIGSLEVRIEQDLKLKIKNSRKFHFSGKRPSVSIENEKSEYAEITPQPKEWLPRKSASMRLQSEKKERLLFSADEP